MRRFGSVVAMVSALVVVSGCSSDGARESSPSESNTAAESGPRLDGTYSVEIGNFVTDNGADLRQGAGTFDVVIRSACRDGACVATAAAPNANEPNALQAEVVAGELIFDYIDGRWVAVETWTGKCRPAEGGDRAGHAQLGQLCAGVQTGRNALRRIHGPRRARDLLRLDPSTSPHDPHRRRRPEGRFCPTPRHRNRSRAHPPPGSTAPTNSPLSTSPPALRPARPAARR